MVSSWKFSETRAAWPEMAEQAVGDGAEVEAVQRVHIESATKRVMARPPQQRLEEKQGEEHPDHEAS